MATGLGKWDSPVMLSQRTAESSPVKLLFILVPEPAFNRPYRPPLCLLILTYFAVSVVIKVGGEGLRRLTRFGDKSLKSSACSIGIFSAV